jgi:hypothetical protein
VSPEEIETCRLLVDLNETKNLKKRRRRRRL